MSKIKLINLFIVIVLLCSNVFTQSNDEIVNRLLFNTQLKTPEKKLIDGDKTGLFELANFFDSKEQIIEYLGYHRVETTESEVAKRIILENTIFLPSEISITETTSKKEFLNFLKANESKIVFSKDAEAFLVTPLENRSVEFEVLEISSNKRQQLQKRINDLLNLDWVKSAGIDKLIEAKNPEALFKIVAHLFQKRSKWNNYYYDQEKNLDLLQYLTETQIVVKDEKNEFSYHIESDYDPTSKLNLLSFFAKYYKSYKFDNKQNIFVNSNLSAKAKPQERIIFEKLFNDDDEIALDAFVKITELNPNIIGRIADEYEKTNLGMDTNRSLPTFPFRFLKQLALLTDYCRKNGTDYKGAEKMEEIFDNLKEDLSISQRYALENKIINEISLEEITAFEYWALIYSSNWKLTHSITRILDKTYSHYWNEIIANDKQLNLYLKKSKLFRKIIAGSLNMYLSKFIDAQPNVVARLRKLKTSDNDINEQISEILQLKPSSAYLETPKKEIVDVPQDLEYQLKGFASIGILEDEKKKELIITLSKISYEQIGIAIKYLEQINFKNPDKFRSKYEFLKVDWGFELVGDFDNESIRKEFLENYSKMSQSKLYAFYLDKHNFDFKKSDNSLDLDKVYEMLKYDVVEAFAGGWSKREKHIYSLIKLLENEFKTTLGFMNKLCMGQNIYSCSSHDRAKFWMKFLEKNNNLKLQRKEPTSFTFRGD